jgi:hypothetical protein
MNKRYFISIENTSRKLGDALQLTKITEDSSAALNLQ